MACFGACACHPRRLWSYLVSQYTHSSPRPWRDIARELAREPDAAKRRELMDELNESIDPRFAKCAICGRLLRAHNL